MTLVLAVGGCQTLLLAGIGGESAYIGWQQFNTDADLALAIVKPINTALCGIELQKPHGTEAVAALTAFCSHLPSDVPGVLLQAATVIAAIDSEKATAARDAAGP